MSRRMIDPQAIIKSQIADDEYLVDLNEILEKYGTQGEYAKNITLQFYSKEAADDTYFTISSDTETKAYLFPNTAITITKTDDGLVIINGLMVNNYLDMNLLYYIQIGDGDYEEFGIRLSSEYHFDVHVIKV